MEKCGWETPPGENPRPPQLMHERAGEGGAGGEAGEAGRLKGERTTGNCEV